MFPTIGVSHLLTVVLLCFLHSSLCVSAKKKVLADLTSNKLTRETDGSFGLWSFHGFLEKLSVIMFPTIGVSHLLTVVLLCFLHSSLCVSAKKKVLADLTSNKLTRENDGSFGLWSFHGTAAESHADQTVFTYNADLLSSDGSRHLSIASTLYPWMGLTSDLDPLFQEYLFLQARAAGIDGFLLEWGHMNHSSNTALRQLLRIAKKYGAFTLAINWCDHWLTTELKNKTSGEVVDAFHRNLQYLIDTVFILGPEVVLYHGNHPVIFIFGGGLTSEQFKDLLARPLRLPPDMATPIWIGSYLNFASGPALWGEWGGLLNGTFGWAPFIEKPTPANMSEWDYYGTLEDAVQYQRNLSKFGNDCVATGSCVLWCGSASPGFDNRGCAGWGRSLRYLPRRDLETHRRSTYNAQWEFYIGQASSPDVIIVPTMNDFPEATVILPTGPSMGTLHSTAWLSAKWKNVSADTAGVSLPASWFSLYRQAIFYQRTPHLNVSLIISALEHTASLINNTLYAEASSSLHTIRKDLQKLASGVKVTNLTIDLPSEGLYPTVKPTTQNGSYVVSKTDGLFLAVEETKASLLRAANFKGLLRFEYHLQKDTFSHLKVYSSTSRQNKPPRKEPLVSRYSESSREKEVFVKHGDFAEVCDIMVTSSGPWESAVVALLKVNQAWDHSAEHSSDLYFVADESFLLRNISIEFQVFSVDPS